MLYSDFFAMLKSFYPDISPKLAECIKTNSQIIHYPKNATILDYGEVCKSCFFMLEGLVVARFTHDGQEKVSWFMGGGDMIVAVDSFYKQCASDEKLIALTDVICISLSYEALQKIYLDFPEFNFIGRRLTEEHYIRSMERNRWISFSPRERYHIILEKHPRLFREVSNTDIAAYIGIDKSTLYRIRKQYLNQRKLQMQSLN
jgi:CRP-like cAMP-binding protein